MKKLFLTIISVMLSIGAWADFSGSGSGTSSDPYIIVNPNQLNELRNFLNNANVYFKMEDDIDLALWIKNNNPTQGWQPVGVSASPFKGHLDGNGKTIKNFMVNRTSNYVGLFGYIVGAEIKNLSIEGTVKGGENTGGFAGYCAGNSKISNVHFSGNVTGGNYTGGLIGTNKSNTLTNVWVKGNVTGNNTVGGMLGYSEYSNCTNMSYEGDLVGVDEVGGICGRNYSNDRRNIYPYTSCIVKGTIHANDYVGGIVGIFPEYNPFSMTSCGAVIDIIANSYVGGLCGKSVGRGIADTSINKCYVIGSLTCSGSYVGGLIGYAHDAYDRKYMTNNYFNGSVLGYDNVGGLIGWTYGAQISKNYCAASVNGNSNVGGLVGHIDNSRIYDIGTKIKSCVALNTSVNAVVDKVGRIYGSLNGDIGATMGTADENRALLTTKVSENGIGLYVDDDMQNGTSFGLETMKLRATYQGLGWDFTNDWRSQETECYPYNPCQAAPPIILSGAVSGSTTIHGKSYDGGTVYVSVGNKTYTTTCVGNLWDITTDAQQAGELIRAYAVADGLQQSYYTTQYVEYKGSGTEEDPYQIYTAEDLANLNGSYYYKLMNNIDLSSYINKYSPTEGWTPIGRDGAVMAHFDGANHTISGLWCKSTKDYTGLFANASSNTICNLTVKVATGKKVVGKNYTGILLGNNTNGIIANCHVIGDVEGENYTGGIVGRAYECTIKNSNVTGNVVGTILVGGMVGETTHGSITSSSANVSVSSFAANAYIGGLVGSNSATVTSCLSSGTIISEGAGANAGGLIGTTSGNVTNCYSSSVVKMAFEAVYMGGLIGTNYATVEKCYSAGNLDGAKWAGGLVGENIGANAYVKKSVAVNHIVNVKDPTGYAERVIGGYKDGASTPEKTNYALDEMQVSVNNVPMVVYDDIVNGIAKTDYQLKGAALYESIDWDYHNTWAIDETVSYPYLQWEAEIIPVSSLSLDKTTITIKKGETETIIPTLSPNNATNKGLEWSSSNKNVATVENGVVTAIAKGTAIISATTKDGSNLTKTCAVTVVADDEEPSIDVEDTDITQYDNVVYVNSVEGRPGSQVTLSVQMNNADPVYGYEFRLYLPAGITVATETDAYGDTNPMVTLTTGRTSATRHTFESSINAEGMLTVLCYSTKKYTFVGNSGEVAQIVLNVADNVEAGDYPIIIKGEAISLEGLTPEIDHIKSTLTISDFKLGDANGDTKVNVGDITTIAGYILGSTSGNFVFKGADANEDNKVNVGDITTIAGMILNGTANSAKSRIAKSVGSAQFGLADAIVACGGEIVVPVYVKNSEAAFSSFQFDVNVPEGFKVKGINANANRVALDYLQSAEMENGVCRVLGYSLRDRMVRGTEGAVVYLTLSAEDVKEGTYDFSISNGVFAQGNSIIESAEVKATITVADATAIFGIASADQQVTVYDVNGRAVKSGIKASDCLDGLSKGIYIVNGVKIVK